jgi:hypothetical protein
MRPKYSVSRNSAAGGILTDCKMNGIECHANNKEAKMKTLKVAGMEKTGVGEQEKKEAEAWKTSKFEGVDDFTIENIINKIHAIKFFHSATAGHDGLFRKADSILEFDGKGAGMGFLHSEEKV